MLDPNLNPYKDAKDLSPWQWMIKYEGKKMLFSFIFTLVFIFFPWIGQWYIDTTWLRWLITIAGILINFAATFLHPYLTYRTSLEDYKRWDKNNKKGWYK